MQRFLLKIVTVMLCVAFTCNLAACGDKQSLENNGGEEGFVKPVGYASIVEVKINPTVNLYLDADNNVMAIEYVNKDAEETYKASEGALIGKSVTDCITEIVEKAVDSGFLKENKKVTINLVASVDTVDENKVLKDAAKAAKQVIDDKKLNFEVNVKKGGKDVDSETLEPLPDNDSGNESINAAECEHSFKTATCTSAKTCEKCGVTDGKPKGHSYDGDACIACGGKDPNYKALNTGVWRAQSVAKEVLYTVYANFKDEGDGPYFSVWFGSDVNKLQDEATKNDLLENHRDKLTLIDGIYYYSGSGDGDTFTYTENKNSIVLTAPSEYFVIKLERISSNQLKIIDGSDLLIPSGIILTWCEE